MFQESKSMTDEGLKVGQNSLEDLFFVNFVFL